MPLKTRQGFPPGHWQYMQMETGWVLQGGQTFQSAVRLIANHRAGNNLPRSDFNAAADDLDTYTCYRIHHDPDYCLPDPNAPKPPTAEAPAPAPAKGVPQIATTAQYEPGTTILIRQDSAPAAPPKAPCPTCGGK
jgi:hypothetical protein